MPGGGLHQETRAGARRLRNQWGRADRSGQLGYIALLCRDGYADAQRFGWQLGAVLPADEYAIVLEGVDDKQAKLLPEGIMVMRRTNNVAELADIYSAADVFVNPTWQDNFPTTNLEALACGTPVVTYRTGGSPEAVDEKSGFVVEQGDISGLAKAVNTICSRGKNHYSAACRQRALDHYDKDDCFKDYVKLYELLLLKN